MQFIQVVRGKLKIKFISHTTLSGPPGLIATEYLSKLVLWSGGPILSHENQPSVAILVAKMVSLRLVLHALLIEWDTIFGKP